ncbi:MAG: 2-amino-4-hydroxy-6-hydroxymethyldihydropteridine diphosphokinase [Gammaproteobacteria bacterium]|nr:2-amino-4-hydroxy-6-hydroxymethyldihydropteridine diphosphokinase [Gammaproteobacteria bacterium]
MSRVWISVGSNIDRERSVRAALWELRRLFGDLVISPVYETAAVGFDGDAFLNLVVGIETARAPGELHALLRDIEASHGRVRSAARFDARTLDLDVLTYGDAVTDEGGKQLPRDEILKYAFVLGPLADVAPDECHPQDGRSYGELWRDFGGSDKNGMVRLDAPAWLDGWERGPAVT